MSATRGIGKFTRLGIGLNVFFMVAASLGIWFLVNLIAGLPAFWTRWDLTQGSINTLAPQTRQILNHLPGEVEVSVFVRIDPQSHVAEVLQEIGGRLAALLDQYRFYSDKKLQYEIYSVNDDYARARNKLQELEMESDNNLVVIRYGKESSAPKRVLSFSDLVRLTPLPVGSSPREVRQSIDDFGAEEAINQAILSVTAEKRPQIGFLAGHLEASVQDQDPAQGLFQFGAALRQLNYELVEIQLADRPEALADLESLFIMGPRRPLTAEEVAEIREYLDRGGRVFLALDPVQSREQDSIELINLLYDFGIDVGFGTVCAFNAGSGMDMEQRTNLRVQHGLHNLHPITNHLLKAGLPVFFPQSRSLQLLEPSRRPKDVTFIELASTAYSYAYAWDDLPGGRPLWLDGAERYERKILAYAIQKDREDSQPPARLVVVGTSSMARNAFFSYNRDFLVNSVSWLDEKENIEGIDWRRQQERRMEWTPQRQELFYWICVIGLPGLSILSGIVVWFFRRR